MVAFWVIARPPVRRFPNLLIPHHSPSAILNVMADLGLLLLVPGRPPHHLRLPPPPSSLPEPSESLAVATPSLDSISKDIDCSPFHLLVSQALVPVGVAAGDYCYYY